MWNLFTRPMSEFKFTCPVCGQHMAVDAGAAGAQIECPTCFQRIIVPRAPRVDSKYILSATQYIKPQAPSVSPIIVQPVAIRPRLVPAILVSTVVVGLLGFALYMMTQKSDSDAAQPPAFPLSNAGPDGSWSLNLGGATFPQLPATGKVHDRGFTCQRAILQGNALALSQNSGSAELIVNVYFPNDGVPDKEIRVFNVRTNHAGNRPQVALRWREGNSRGTQTFTNGYAMKLELAQAVDDRIPGKIYLCLPDDSQSFIAGTFDAEVRKSPPAKQR